MKRQREKHITRLHIILFFLVVIIGIIIFIVFKVKQSSNLDKYKKLEEEMVIAAEIYYQINDIYLAEGNERKINLSQLKKQNLITNDLKDKCEGYVLSTSEKNLETNDYEVVNNAYIKCGKKYITANYEEY